jgi:hypothetical protein
MHTVDYRPPNVHCNEKPSARAQLAKPRDAAGDDVERNGNPLQANEGLTLYSMPL